MKQFMPQNSKLAYSFGTTLTQPLQGTATFRLNVSVHTVNRHIMTSKVRSWNQKMFIETSQLRKSTRDVGPLEARGDDQQWSLR